MVYSGLIMHLWLLDKMAMNNPYPHFQPNFGNHILHLSWRNSITKTSTYVLRYFYESRWGFVRNNLAPAVHLLCVCRAFAVRLGLRSA
jgi:hypothetical protein